MARWTVRLALLGVAGALVCGGVGSGTGRNGAIAAEPSLQRFRLASSFSADGTLELDEWHDVRRTHPLDDGYILVQLDRRDSTGAIVDTGVAKVRPNGTLDPSFAAAGSTPGILDVGGPTGPLAVRADGRFLVGTRQYLADGSVDSTFGEDGYLTAGGGHFGGAYFSVVETSAHELAVLGWNPLPSNGCVVWPVDADGDMGIPFGSHQDCYEAVPVAMPDGSLVVVGHTYLTGFTLMVLPPGPLANPPIGTVVEVDGSWFGSAGWLVDATATPDGKLVTVHGGSGGFAVQRLFLDGTLDPTFGIAGVTAIDGVAESVTVDTAGRTAVGISYTFVFGPAVRPDRAAIVRLTSTGSLDRQFNSGGPVPGWVSTTEVGFDSSTGRMSHLPRQDGGWFVTLETWRDGRRWQATVLAIEPVVIEPPPTTVPSLPTTPTQLGPATAHERADRVGVVAADSERRVPPTPMAVAKTPSTDHLSRARSGRRAHDAHRPRGPC